MKKFLFALALVAAFAATAAHAHTSESVLFTCAGELIKSQGNDGKNYYSVVESWLRDKEDVLPMDCDIDEGKALRQVLAVCRVGDLCTVAAKGESGNGNRYLIQKVFEVQRQPASVLQDFKRTYKP
jgi:hypothetical protein